MFAPALLASAIASSEPAASATTKLGDFTARASVMLLEGTGLPSNYRDELMTLPPSDRLQAIIFLRRSGLLQGDLWSLEDVLRPALAPVAGEAVE